MSLRFKRYYPLILLLVGVLTILAVALGDTRVIAYTTSSGTGAAVPSEGYDYTNSVDLFDDTVVHSVHILISDEDYDAMITTYQQTGLKEYFPADIIIDSVRINNVGIRLKGNSSLRMAVGGSGDDGNRGEGNRPGNFPGGDAINPPAAGNRLQRPEGGAQPQWVNPQQPPVAPSDGALPQPGEMPQMPANGAQPQFDNGVMPFSVEGGVKIPYLIKFDEYESGQTYQGHSFLSLRTYGMASDNSMLQEPVTNAMFRLVGLPAALTSYAGLQLNDEPETLYVLSEVLNDESYLERNFSNPNGILFKAELGSSLAYVDDDPSSYVSSFSQETRENDAGYAPLIEFIHFLDASDDATFEQELPNYLDVDSFATYLAVNDLLVNTDSLIGMNNNYYLYYDDTIEQFILLYWDGNESLGKLAGGNNTTFDLYFTSGTGVNPGMRGMGGQNTLLERFMSIPAFKALYESELKQVYQQVYLSNAITAQINQYAALIRSANVDRNLVTLETYEASVNSVLEFVTGRMEYLEMTELLGGQ